MAFAAELLSEKSLTFAARLIQCERSKYDGHRNQISLWAHSHSAFFLQFLMALLPQHNHRIQHKPFQNHAVSVSATIPLNTTPGVTGYAQVADFIATDKELAVYRRFDRTAARLLLQLQSEILSLQTALDAIDQDDASDQDEKRQLAAATISRELPQHLQSARDIEKQRIYIELRKIVKEYCK